VTPAQATLLRPLYRLSYLKHVRDLTMFLLVRQGGPGGTGGDGSPP